MRNLSLKTSIVVIFLVCLFSLHTIASPWAHEQIDHPIDQRVKFSELDNGFKYAILNLPKPDFSRLPGTQRHPCSLRLHLSVGSLNEEDHEWGMAHFLEHMAFRGGKRFGPGEMLKAMQSMGVSFGTHLNAHTGHTETVYKFDLPSCTAENLDQALLAIRDISADLLITEEDVQSEKGPVDAEDRLMDEKTRDHMRDFAKILVGSQFSTRNPMGEKHVRDAFTAQSVRRFYEKWYRAPAMKLIVAGELPDNGANLNERILEIFGDLEAGPSIESPRIAATGVKKTLSSRAYANHPASTVRSLRVQLTKVQVRDLASHEHRAKLMLLSALLMRKFSNEMLEAKAQEITINLFDYCDDGLGFQRNCATPVPVLGFGFTVTAAHEDIRTSFAYFEKAMLETVRDGFTDEEFDWLIARVKESTKASTQKGLPELVDYLLDDARSLESFEDPHWQNESVERFLSTFNKEEARQMLANIWTQTPAITATGNEQVPTEKELEDISRSVEDFVNGSMSPVVAQKPSTQIPYVFPSTTGQFGRAIFGASHSNESQDLQFANGVQVEIRSYPFEKSTSVTVELAWTGSIRSRADFVTSWVGARLFPSFEIGPHSFNDLNHIFSGYYETTLSDHLDGFFMSQKCNDLLSCSFQGQLELLAGYLRDPKISPDWLERFKKGYRLNQQAKESHAGDFQTFLCAIHLGDGLRNCPPTADEVDAVSVKNISDLVIHSLKNAPIRVHITTGHGLNEAALAVAKTLGTLPPRDDAEIRECYRPEPFDYLLSSLNNGTSPFWDCEGRKQTNPLMRKPDHCEWTVSSFVSGVKMDSNSTGIQSAALLMAYPVLKTPTFISENARYDSMRLLALILTDRLQNHIRHTLGLSYGIEATANRVGSSLHYGEVMIGLDFDPAKADFVLEQVFSECELLAKDGPTQNELDLARAQLEFPDESSKEISTDQIKELASLVLRRELVSYERVLPQ